MSSLPYVTQLAGGGHVVVWTSGEVDSSGTVYAQIFDANGQKAGAPITVFGDGRSWTTGGAGALPDGSFVVSGSAYMLVGDADQTRLYVQKVSATGQLVATGGVSDAGVNGGLAARLLSEPLIDTRQFAGASFFVNADGSYAMVPMRVTRATPLYSVNRLLLNVDANSNLVGAPVELSIGYSAQPAPVVTRLRGGNFLVAGTSTITYAPVVWKVVTATGQVVAQQSLGAAPGNATTNPQVTALADGTGLLTWRSTISTGDSWVGERIDASGNVVGTASTSNHDGLVTGLPAGGYVLTRISGSQLLAQYFDAAGSAVGDEFVVAGEVLGGYRTAAGLAPYSITATSDGFIAAYTAPTSAGAQVFEIRFTGP